MALALLVILGLSGAVSCKKAEPGTWPSESPPVPCEESRCLSELPWGWRGPVSLWTGPEADAPPCPERA